MDLTKYVFVKRKWTIASIVILIPIGFYTKFYSGLGSSWVNDSLGGVFYVIFWSLLLSLFLPKIYPLRVSIIVFTVTCVLEFLQLWHPAFLESIRSNFIGQTLIGTSFSKLDFLHYFIGFIVSLVVLKYFRKIEIKNIDDIQKEV